MQNTSTNPITVESSGRTFNQVMKDVEAAYIIQLLETFNMNKTQAARAAGLSYHTFVRKVASLDLEFTISVRKAA